MRRDYTNKNKRFYDRSQYESPKRIRDKNLKLKAELLFYIFNNLNSFEELMDKLLEEDFKYEDFKRTASFRISTISTKGIYDLETKAMSYFQIVYDSEPGHFYSLYKLWDNVLDFFTNFRYSYFQGLNIEKEYSNIMSDFLIQQKFNENIFIKIICKELKDNLYLKRYNEKLDFEILLKLAMENIDILEIASPDNKKEILEILECVE